MQAESSMDPGHISNQKLNKAREIVVVVEV